MKQAVTLSPFEDGSTNIFPTGSWNQATPLSPGFNANLKRTNVFSSLLININTILTATTFFIQPDNKVWKKTGYFKE